MTLLGIAFRLAVRSSFVFARSNCDWLKYITGFILANHSCCLQKQRKIELQVEIIHYELILMHYNVYLVGREVIIDFPEL